MAQDPDLMLFDEPESGVDMENIQLVGKTIAKLLQKDLETNGSKTLMRKKLERTKMGLIITHTGIFWIISPRTRGRFCLTED